MTERESKICDAAREAVSVKPQKLRDVAESVNMLVFREHLGNPVTAPGVAAIVGKFARATLRQVTRDGELWLQAVEQP